MIDPVDGPTREELATLLIRFLFGTPGNRSLLAVGALELAQYAVLIFLALGALKTCSIW